MSFLKELFKLAKEKTYAIRIGMLLISSSIILIAYLFLETNDNLEYQKKELAIEKKAYLKTSIFTLSNEATTMMKQEAELINSELSRAYPKNSRKAQQRLEDDLEKYIDGSLEVTPLSSIMYNHVKGHYFNVNNDNNDPFVIAVIYVKVADHYEKRYIITSDYSTNCLTPNPRTLEKEIQGKQFAKGLVIPAITKIVDDGATLSIWHFITPPSNTPWINLVKNMKSTELDDILNYTDVYGTPFLKGFEFLQAVRLNEGSDLAGRDFVIRGSRANTKATALYYFNGYNFDDQLTTHTDIREGLASFDKKYSDLVREANGKKKIYLLFLALDTILVIMSTYALHRKQ